MIFSFLFVVPTDAFSPVISNCPSDLTVYVANGVSSSVVSWTEPTATDNLGAVRSFQTSAPGATFGVGTTTVTYTFEDTVPNQSTCSFDVSVVGEYGLKKQVVI